MAKAEQREIDWGSAEINDRTLTVGLTGASHKDWSRDFAGVITLLARADSRWGEVKLTKSGIEVQAVQEGAEAELRHLLESVVLQVNADLAPEAEEHAAAAEPDPQLSADRQMQEAFRSFAESDS